MFAVLLGKRIAEEELKGESRAEYGKRIIPCLAERLTTKYGQGFDRTNLYYYLDFAKVYPTLFEDDTQTKRIIHTLCEQSDIYSSLVSETPIQITKMPTQDELRREIEQQKMIFALKSGKEKA